MADLKPARTEIGQVPALQFDGSLVIFTSFYEQHGYAGYIHSLAVTQMVLERLGVKYDYWPASGDFHVERAVNKALTEFVNSEHTDFLCIDADESWDAAGLLRVINAPEDIVGAAYPMKNRWQEWTAQVKTNEQGHPMGIMREDGSPFLEAERLPFGFLRLKKAPLQAYQAAHPDRWYWDGELKVTQFISMAIRDHQLFSQDFNFCEDLKALGFRLWMEPDVTIGHFGLVEHIGNWDKDMQRRHKERQAFATVAQMADHIANRREAA